MNTHELQKTARTKPNDKETLFILYYSIFTKYIKKRKNKKSGYVNGESSLKTFDFRSPPLTSDGIIVLNWVKIVYYGSLPVRMFV